MISDRFCLARAPQVDRPAWTKDTSVWAKPRACFWPLDEEDARLWGGRGPLNRLANLVQPLSRGEAVPYHTLDDVLGTQANAAKPSHWIVLLGCVLLAAEVLTFLLI